MSRHPGILWIFLRVLLTAIGVFVAAAVVGWLARVLSGKKKPERVAGRSPELVNADPPLESPSYLPEDVVDVSYSEVEEVRR